MADNAQDGSGGMQSPGDQAAARKRAVKWAWYRAVAIRRHVALGVELPPNVTIDQSTSTSEDSGAETPPRKAEPIPPVDPPAIEDQVGIALSGGGLRSALFSVGLLQAFFHRGLLRYVDYVSSVSGGGYASGWMVAQTHLRDAKTGSLHSQSDFTLGLDAGTGQLTSSYQLTQAGRYLWRFRDVAWRWMFDTILMCALVLNVVFAFAFSVAYVWRTLDTPSSRRVLETCGLTLVADELFIAFLPSVALLIAWLCAAGTWWTRTRLLINSAKSVQQLFAWGIVAGASLLSIIVLAAAIAAVQEDCSELSGGFGTSIGVSAYLWTGVWWRFVVAGYVAAVCVAIAYSAIARLDRTARLSCTLFWCLAGSMAVSVAVYLGDGETQVAPDQATFQLNTFATTIGIAATVLQLLPLFFGNRMLQSEQEEASLLQKRIYWIVTWSAPTLLVFAAVHIAAMENISSIADYRDPDITALDVVDWRDFPNKAISNRAPDTSSQSGAEGDTRPHVAQQPRDVADEAQLATLYHQNMESLDIVAAMIRTQEQRLRGLKVRATGDQEGYNQRSTAPLLSVTGTLQELSEIVRPLWDLAATAVSSDGGAMQQAESHRGVDAYLRACPKRRQASRLIIRWIMAM